MSRFFVLPEAVGSSTITVTAKEDIAHISKVLRMKIGDIVDISDSDKWEYTCEIKSIEKEEICLKIIDKQRFAREPNIRITLFQGIPKQGKMETIIQKNTELGISTVSPVFMARSVVTNNGKFHKKIERYKVIAEQAAKQCKRGRIPKVQSACDFSDMLNMLSRFDAVIFPYENEENNTIKNALRELEKLKKASPEALREIAVIIGPEGGFADDEAKELISAGAVSVSLGKTVLRTETAGIAAVSMIMYELEMQ